LSGDQIRVFLAQNLGTDQRHVVLSPRFSVVPANTSVMLGARPSPRHPRQPM
jgi:hypothetical protein